MGWESTLKSLAPLIGTAIGGPFGGMASKLLASALDTDEDGIEEKIASGDPEIYLKVKQAEQDFKLRCKELDIKESQLEYQDRADARNMHVQNKDKMVPTIAVVVIVGFFAMVVAVLMGWSKADSVIAGTLIGYVSAKAEQVIGFYFGSSKGSKDKTTALTKVIGNQS